MEYKRLFQAAAVWNIGLGGSLGLFYERLLPLLKMPEAITSPLFLSEVVALVITFGIGYYWVSRDFKGNIPIVKLGVIGKLLVFFTGLYWTTKNGCSLPVLALLSGDFIFAVLFIVAIRKTMRVPAG
ncbi:MAG: hypothetical protein JEZ12_23105 [Desulfobacterium sp.]|nr:hypothetical protein [Desulfobacterium sp.]